MDIRADLSFPPKIKFASLLNPGVETARYDLAEENTVAILAEG